jgi:hypothetical protein
MNSRTAKLCRKFADAIGMDPDAVKAAWKRTPRAKRARTRRKMREGILQAKLLRARAPRRSILGRSR